MRRTIAPMTTSTTPAIENTIQEVGGGCHARSRTMPRSVHGLRSTSASSSADCVMRAHGPSRTAKPSSGSSGGDGDVVGRLVLEDVLVPRRVFEREVRSTFHGSPFPDTTLGEGPIGRPNLLRAFA